MITSADAALHISDDPAFAETNYFPMYVPERSLYIGLYLLARSNFGCALSTVCMNSRRVDTPWDAEYCDMQMYLPIGNDFDMRNYRLANGLAVRSPEPNQVWEIDFDDGAGTEVHVTYRALMPPFDIHDPDQSPMVDPNLDGKEWNWGRAYDGHYNLSGHIEGEVILRGDRLAIDCVSFMDHSWGPRPERFPYTMSWIFAGFSKDLTIQAICNFEPVDQGIALTLGHGYVLEDGNVYGLTAGTGKTLRRGWYPQEIRLEVTDIRDKTWTLSGLAHSSFPWQAWPNVVGFTALMRWELEDGRVGMGEVEDFLGLETLTALKKDY